MLYLALLSGLINLASQSVFMRVVSAANGNYYLTYYLTTLSFIVFSAAGNLLSARLRRWLPLVELLAGVYALAIFAGIHNGLLATLALPAWAAVLMLVPPAFALGVHVPLYAHFTRKPVGLTYGIYHLGAAVGVIALEWFVLPWVRLSAALGVLGVAQVPLSMLVMVQLKRAGAPDSAPVSTPVAGAERPALASLCFVLAASFASYLSLCWGLKGFEYLLEPSRMHLGLYNGAVLLMMSLGGLLATTKGGNRTAGLIALVGVWLAAGLMVFSAGPSWLRATNGVHATLALEGYALGLALVFSIPVLLSATVFSRYAEAAGGERDVASGRLLAVAALGNVLGGAVAMSTGNWMLTIWPAIVSAAVLLVALGLFTGPASLRSRVRWALPAVLGAAVGLGLGYQPMKTTFALRSPGMTVLDNVFSTILGSTAGYVNFYSRGQLPKNIEPPHEKMYFVDGHTSHVIEADAETAIGLNAAKVIDAPFGHSMVVGLGSGQTGLGVSLISKQTDIVEISPAVVAALPTMAIYNHRVWERPGVRLVRADGLDFMRHCAPGSYDFIFNTSTYAVQFNAYKLYTDEFDGAAARCLKPDGLYQMYVDQSMAQTQEQVREFLAPVARHFKYIYISVRPYPIILAANHPLQPHSEIDFHRLAANPEDAATIVQDTQLRHNVSCAGWAPAGPFTPVGTEPLSTLDNPVVERNSMRLRPYLLTHGMFGLKSDLFNMLRPYNTGYTTDVCAFRPTHPIFVHLADPLVMPVYGLDDVKQAATAPTALAAR
jgi:spermidine synthase